MPPGPRDVEMTLRPSQPRRSFFRKYFLALFAAVVVPLLANGGSEAWLGYRDQRARLDERLGLEAARGGRTDRGVRRGIRDQLGWMVQPPWTDGLRISGASMRFAFCAKCRPSAISPSWMASAGSGFTSLGSGSTASTPGRIARTTRR